MTTLELPVPPTWQTPPITRSIHHEYTYQSVTYPGVTSIIDIVGASFQAASRWGANQAADAAIRLVDELPKMLETLGPKGLQKALASRESWGPDPSGSILGTQTHEAIERYLTSELWTMEGSPVDVRVKGFAKWWQASGWRLRLSEGMVVRPATNLLEPYDGWGGTFDILAYDRDGATVLADIKTGNVYAKVALQLAGYSMASLVQPAGAMQVYPMPKVDRHVVIHVTAEGTTEREVHIGTPEHMAFLAALDIYHWTQSMKGKF